MSNADLKNVVRIGLSAAIVSVADERPCVLVVHHDDGTDALPFGPFDPLKHRTLESGLRTWVSEQTYLELGYAEQLYTFGDRGRHLLKAGEGPRLVSVGYLALTRGGTKRKPLARSGAIGTGSFRGKTGARRNLPSSTPSLRRP